MEHPQTAMVIPVSKRSFFNTKGRETAPLCQYDMLFHPPDFNPKALRSDRQQPEMIRQHIWDQEYHKPISSTNHFMYGRPYWPILDRVMKQFARRVSKDDNPNTRIHNVLSWVVLLTDGKTVCV